MKSSILLFTALTVVVCACNKSEKSENVQTQFVENTDENPEALVAELPNDKSKKNTAYTIASYNVENLYDTQDDPNIDDEEFLPSGKKKWDNAKYTQKLKNLAEVIKQIGDPDGAEIIGLCEIENKKVLEDLAAEKQLKKYKYEIAHFDSPDKRGIDVALLYKKSAFTVTETKKYEVIFSDRDEPTTRDVLYVKGNIIKEEPLHILVVHFPSRREGKKKSEPRRINAAKVVRKIVDEILATDANAKIIIMGDCNDEPTDISLTQYIKADNSQTPNDGILFNAMYSLHQAGKGSYFHENKFDMIDNLIVSDGLLFAESGIKYKKNSAAVFQPLFITQQKPEKFKGAPQRTFAGDKYFSNGYSDHFPIYCILEKK